MKRVNTLLIFALLSFATAFSQTVADLTKSTNAFLETLSPNELKAVSYPFTDSLRLKWTNLPVGMEKRPGVRYGDLSSESKIKFHDILTTIFSSQGYLKTHNIMSLDDYLINLKEIELDHSDMDKTQMMDEMENLEWGFGNYYVSVWGQPANEGSWGLKFEGHHLSLNITVVKGELRVTPFFLGTDPVLVRETQFAGLRPMSKEEDYGLELFNMLTENQKSTATISNDFPKDIITSPSGPQRLTTYEGIKGSDLTDKQKTQLKYLILEYLRNFERERAGDYINNIQTNGVENIYFGWIGGDIHDSFHYYIINGPDFLIEYDNAGYFHKGDHIHTIFRDKKDDFGEDLLKEHYQKEKH